MIFEMNGIRYHLNCKKLFLNFILIMGLLGLGLMYIPHVADAGSVAKQLSITVHRVDTLWSIAESLAPNSDPRATIAAIIDQNHLAQSDLQAGQKLIFETNR
jgi:hypothetical protein